MRYRIYILGDDMVHWGTWQTVRLVFAAALVFVGPFLDLRMLRRLKGNPAPEGRLRFYRRVSLFSAILGLVSWGLMGCHGVVRLAPQVMADAGVLGKPISRLMMAVLSLSFCGAALLPGVFCVLRKKSQMAYTKALAKVDLCYLFPVSGLERRWWLVVSLTAGVFEEVIVRGFLLQVACGELRLGLLTALLVTSAVFGLAHIYQGLSGMAKTGLTGLALGCIAIVTGGLLLPMLLHTILDAQVLIMYRPSEEVAPV